MCHELLCCFGHREPEKRPPSGREEDASSHPKPSAAIDRGAQTPSQRKNIATINQDEIQDQAQIKNGNNKEKPISSPIQGEKQQKDNQDQQNGQEQDEKKLKLSKIAKALSFKPKGSKEDTPQRVPPEDHKSSEEKQKVLSQDVFPKEQEKYSPKEQDLGTKKQVTPKQQQIPSPPKEQVLPPKEETDQKTKILFAKGNKEFDPSGDDSCKQEDKSV